MGISLKGGFTISIFVPSGNPDGLRFVEKTDWVGKAVVTPRAQFPEARQRPEFDQTGVYVLIGPSEASDQPIVYIGEGDPVKPRLDQHYTQKDFWTSLIAFTSKDKNLNKAHVQYLEARLVALAREAKRCELENANTPQRPTLSESDEAWMEGFLGQMLSIFPILGLSAFEKPSRTHVQQKAEPVQPSVEPAPVVAPAPAPTMPERELLFINRGGIEARGYDAPAGFVVLAGSAASKTTQPSFSLSSKELRNVLIKQVVLVEDGNHMKFTQDYTFGSPSGAANIILGGSINGRTEWKNAEGKTLKALQTLAIRRTSG
jgi:hypothetical protein